MTKRPICDVAFILFFIVMLAFFIAGHKFTIDNGFINTCLLFSFLVLILSRLQMNRKKIMFFLFFLLLTVSITFTYRNYKEEVLEKYLSDENIIEGVLYFDDPVHKENGNLIIKLESHLKLKLSYKIRIYDNKRHLENISEGSKISIKYKNLYIKEKSNYGEFDYKNYLRGIDISGVLMIKRVVSVSEGVESAAYFYRELWLGKLYKSLFSIVGESEKTEFVYALLSGSKSAVDNDVIEMFKVTSTIHLLTVSGFHFAIIYMFLERFMWLLKVPRNAKLLLLILFMTIYYIITPMKFSCLRALIMIIILIVSKLINRQFDFMCALSFVVILSIVLNPYVVYDLSFLLTYLACIGIGVVYKSFSKIEKYVSEFPSLVKKSMSIVVLSISIQLTLMLYFLIDSSNINLISAFINIPLSFLISILIMLTIPYVLLVKTKIVISLNEIFNIPSYIISLIYKQLSYFANLDVFIYSISKHKYILFPILLALVFLLYLKQNVSKFKNLDTITIISILTLILIIPTNILSNEKNLQIIFNDIGQGDSAMIITEEGKSILIDLGDGKIAVSKLAKAYGIEKVDILILSHGHADHIGGREFLSDIKADLVIAPLHMKEQLTSIKSKKHIVEKRFVLSTGDLKLDIVPIYLDESNLNDFGIVVKVTQKELDILFTGDIESETEKILLGSDLLKSIDILKVPHHGSKTSSTDEFVSAVNPLYAIIPVGENKYGHPDLDVLNRYEKLGSKVIVLKDYGQTRFMYKDSALKYKSYFQVEK